jgi:UTP--glucose-1-phosphate uridylyltransferase
MTIRKAVFPVAGLGTRFLPATKAMPKEMLTVVDRPVIQHVVDEATAAKIEHLCFVTGRNKGVIEDHFDVQFELERTLADRGKTKELAALAEIQPEAGKASFIRQQAPLGLGHAVWCAARRGGRRAVRAPVARHAAFAQDTAVHGADGGCLRQGAGQLYRGL